MPSIPLHCNICPKQPDFSDISHLLTHISSKGHLSHYHKAQVRGRQDTSVRQQLDIYDRWYIENQIEKLLSQRMILKDSKRPNGITRPRIKSNSALSKPAKPADKACSKTTVTHTAQIVQTAPEPVIDPQLSRTPSMQEHLIDSKIPLSSETSAGIDLASIHRAHMPRMRAFSVVSPQSAQWPSNTSVVATSQPEQDDGHNESVCGDETEDDEAQNFQQEKTASLYPEPSLIGSLQSQAPQEPSSPPIRRPCRPRPRRSQTEQMEMSDSEKDFAPQTPELKGVYYPGMSIFDSASPEAQRKRNQRKHTSILAQIEQDSLEVECFEHIYWPDGSLKLARFITGDVQSSPLKEDTPPPPKRHRGKGNKASGPGPKTRKRKARNAPKSSPNASKSPDACEPRCPDLQDLLKRSIPMLDSSFLTFDQTEHHHDFSGTNDWLLNMGVPRPLRHYAVPIPENAPSEQTEDPIRSTSNQSDMDFCHEYQNHGLPFSDVQPHLDPLSLDTSQHRVRDSSTRVTELPSKSQRMRPRLGFSASVLATSTAEENVEPKPNTLGLCDEAVNNYAPIVDAHRVTQRYFYFDNPPEYYTSMPPQMAFGGLAMPSVYRTALNPLNPNALLCQPVPLPMTFPDSRTAGIHGLSSKTNGEDVSVQGAAIEDHMFEVSSFS